MRALRFDGQLSLATNLPLPVPAAGEALLRPLLLGICNTDLEIVQGYAGFRGTLGHEFVAVVERCADTHWEGRRVVGEINAACLRCATCLRGDTSHCPQRTTLGIRGRDGAMADAFCLPTSCLHLVPDEVPDEVAVFAEPLAAAVEVLEQTHLRPTERVAVVGDGKLGMLVAQVLRLPGCEVVVVGRHPERRDILTTLGIAAVAADELPARAFDVVVDCAGNASGLATALRLLRPRGRLVLKSTYVGPSQLDLSVLVVDEIQLLGSRCGPFAPTLRLLERGLVETGPLLAACYSLDEGLEAFAVARGKLKVLLRP